jgi:MFS family permease
MAADGSKGILYLLIIVSFTFWMTLLISPIFPLYVVEDLGATTFVLGLINSISSVSSIILRVPLGMVADRIGRWRMLSIALFITGLSYLLYFLAPAPGWLYLIGILRSVAMASFLPTANAVASNLARSSSERGKIMGIYMTSISVALVIGPLLTSFLLEFLSYRQIFLVTALIGFTGLIASLLGGPYVKRGGYDKVKRKEGGITSSLSRVIKSRNMIALYLTMSVFYFTALSAFYTLFSVYAKGSPLFFSATFISLLFALRGLTDTFTRIPAGYLSDRFGRKRPLMFGLFLMVAALFCLSTPSPLIIIFGCIIYGVGFGFRIVTMSALAGDSVPPEDVGLAMALLFATTDAGSALGSIFAGAASMFLPIPLIFQICAVLLLIATPILLIVREGEPT